MKYLHYFDNQSSIDTTKTYLSPGIVTVENTKETVYADFGENTEYKIKIESGKVISYDPNSYTITLSATTGGSVSGGGTYLAGTEITITATPQTGYMFTQWSDGNTNATRTMIVRKNLNLTATFIVTPLVLDAPLDSTYGITNRITGESGIVFSGTSCTYDSSQNAYLIAPSSYASSAGGNRYKSGLYFDIPVSNFATHELVLMYDVYNTRTFRYSTSGPFSSYVEIDDSLGKGSLFSYYAGDPQRYTAPMNTIGCWTNFKLVISPTNTYSYINNILIASYDINWNDMPSVAFRFVLGLQNDGRSSYYNAGYFKNIKVYPTTSIL